MTLRTTVTMATHLALTADTLIIRPADGRTLQALRWLARNGAAHVERGAICRAGTRQPAWLAFSCDGRLLAAVLIGN